jgi:hypothetical protein
MLRSVEEVHFYYRQCVGDVNIKWKCVNDTIIIITYNEPEQHFENYTRIHAESARKTHKTDLIFASRVLALKF